MPVAWCRGNLAPGATRRWEWVAAVQPAVQLWGEAYVGLVCWTGLVEFMRNIYWFQLAKGGMSFEVGFVAYLFTPALVIAHPILRARLQGHIWSRPLLLLCGLVGIGGQFFWGPLMRIAFAATSVGILGIYVIDGLWECTQCSVHEAWILVSMWYPSEVEMFWTEAQLIHWYPMCFKYGKRYEIVKTCSHSKWIKLWESFAGQFVTEATDLRSQASRKSVLRLKAGR